MRIIGTRSREVEAVIALVRQENPLAFALLFHGVDYHCTHVAVALSQDGEVQGLASYAPLGEDGLGPPTLVGLYTLRAHRRKGVSLRLVQEVIRLNEQERPGTVLSMTAVSTEAASLIPKLAHLKIRVSNQAYGILPGFLL